MDHDRLCVWRIVIPPTIDLCPFLQSGLFGQSSPRLGASRMAAMLMRSLISVLHRKVKPTLEDDATLMSERLNWRRLTL